MTKDAMSQELRGKSFSHRDVDARQSFRAARDSSTARSMRATSSAVTFRIILDYLWIIAAMRRGCPIFEMPASWRLACLAI